MATDIENFKNIIKSTKGKYHILDFMGLTFFSKMGINDRKGRVYVVDEGLKRLVSPSQLNIIDYIFNSSGELISGDKYIDIMTEIKEKGG